MNTRHNILVLGFGGISVLIMHSPFVGGNEVSLVDWLNSSVLQDMNEYKRQAFVHYNKPADFTMNSVITSTFSLSYTRTCARTHTEEIFNL